MRRFFFILFVFYQITCFAQIGKSDIRFDNGFIPNDGQILNQNGESNLDVLYLSSSEGLNVQLRKTGFSYDLFETRDSIVVFHRIDIDFVNLNTQYQIEASGESQNYNRYYTTGVTKNSNLHSYKQITYSDIYPGIDIVFHQNKEGFKYDFVIKAGSNPNQIRLKYSGVDQLEVNDLEQLTMQSRFGKFLEKIPSSYYLDSQVALATYALSNNIVGYNISNYNNAKTLIIDPVPNRVWASYCGGSSTDLARSILASKKTNYIYITGWSNSSNNIATSGSYQSSYISSEDGFIVKMDTSGRRIWGTYIGGSKNDRMTNVIEDNNNNIYAVGESYSSNFGTTSGAFQTTYSGSLDDAIIVKLDSSGKRIWSTYFGGNGYDEAYGVSFDKSKHIYVVGKTSSSNVISTSNVYQNSFNGKEDGFIVKFDTSGKRIWGSYYGGSEQDYIISTAVNSASDIILFGNTASTNGISSTGSFQTSKSGTIDIILSTFDSSGKRKWGTYFGGNGLDYSIGVKCDSFDNIYFYGYTESNSGIASSGAYQTTLSGPKDGLLAKFNKSGQRIWSTYFGGAGNEQIYEGDLYLKGSIVVAGFTTSTSSIATSNSWQTSLSSGDDGFIAKFNSSDGKRVWGSYFGSSGSDKILGISLKDNCIYAAGLTTSNNGISTNGVFQTSFGGGGQDGFIVKFEDDSCYAFAVNYSKKDIQCKGDSNGIISVIPVEGRYPCLYSLNNSTLISDSIFTLLRPGNYKIVSIDARGCSDSTNVIIVEPAIPLKVILQDSMVNYCANTSAIGISKGIGGTAPYNFIWNSNPSQINDTATNLKNGTFQVKIVDKNNCIDSTKLIVVEAQKISLNLIDKNDVTCHNVNNGMAKIMILNAKFPFNGHWNTSPPQYTDSIIKVKAGVYQFNIVDSLGCKDSLSISINQPDSLQAGFNLPSLFVCNNSLSSVIALGKGGTKPYSYIWKTSPKIYTDSLNNVGAGFYEVVISDSNGCKDSAIYSIYESAELNSKIDTFLNISCFGMTDGYAKISVSGATPPIEYKWNTFPNQFSDSAIGLAKGNYICTIKDLANCTDTLTITIEEPALLDVSLDSFVSIMCKGEAIGKGNAAVSGGIGPYNFLWNTLPMSTANKINNLLPGNYQLFVTDFNGCKDSINFKVEEYPSIDLTIQSKWDVSCFGESNGKIVASTSGISPPYIFEWNSIPPQYNDTASNLIAGNYMCIAKDAFGCYDTVSTVINQPKSALKLDSIITDESCLNFNDGSIQVIPNGGTPPYQFNWNTTPQQSTSLVSGLKNGSYLVEVKDSNGCKVQSEYLLIALDSFKNLIMPKDQIICAGDEVNVDFSDFLNTDFLWNDFDTSNIKKFTKEGYYSVQTFHSCGNQNGSFAIEVKNCNCQTSIPNAFTPNNDLLNESFKPIISCDVSDYIFRIYNRWGEKLFETNDLNIGWDGKYKGIEVPNSLYTYYLIFVGSEGIVNKRFSYEGTVLILK